MKTEHKAIIQLSALTILVAVALLSNFLVVSLVYSYHRSQILLQHEVHAERMKQLGGEEHDLNQAIMDLELLKHSATAGM